MRDLFLDIAKTVKTVNNMMTFDSPSVIYFYIKDNAKRYDNRLFVKHPVEDALADNCLTLQQPKKARVFYGIQVGKGNELLQALLHDKKMSDADFIGSNPKDKYFDKWIAYAKRNNNGNSVFEIRHGKVYRLSRHEIRAMVMLFKQALIETVGFNTKFGQASHYINQSFAFATGNGKRIRSKRANSIIKHMFEYYRKAIQYHQGQSFIDYSDLENDVYHGEDFTVKFSPIFNMYFITKNHQNTKAHVKFAHAKNVALVAKSLSDRLLMLSQHYTNTDVDIDVKRDHWVQNAWDAHFMKDVKEYEQIA